MKVIIVDDDKVMLLILKKILSRSQDVEIIGTFNNSEGVLKFIEENHIDIVFLDISMPGENGVELGKKISKVSPGADIVFTTSHREYAVEAFEIHAFDYIVKPVAEERVMRTITRAALKRSQTYSNTLEKEKNISVYLFGGIDVSSKSFGTVKWISAKSMELFTYLLLKEGHNISKSLIVEDIFPNMPLKNAENYLKTAAYQLRKALEPHVSNSVLISNNGFYKLECNDFYVDFIEFHDRINNSININSSNIIDMLKIEKLFVGNLLGDVGYYWSITEREKYLNYYIELAEKLGQYLFHKGELQQGAYILKKLIKFDPFSEEGNCLYMKILAGQKDKKGLIKFYDRYVNRIKEELNINPEAAVTNLYEKLIENFN
jgi:two-component system, LytTR family, response regulator